MNKNLKEILDALDEGYSIEFIKVNQEAYKIILTKKDRPLIAKVDYTFTRKFIDTKIPMFRYMLKDLKQRLNDYFDKL